MIDHEETLPPIRLLLEGSYATYPHSNGFLRGSRRVVLGVAGGPPELVSVDLDDLAAGPVVVVGADEFARATEAVTDVPVWSAGHPTTPVPWFDIALEADVLVTYWGNRLLVTDTLESSGGLRSLYRPEPGWVLHELMSISADGESAFVSESDGEEWVLRRVSVPVGSSEVLIRVPWHANHVHPVPADESWIMFSHEGQAATVSDRMWALHPRLAPAGQVAFDQRAVADVAGATVSIGHERAKFHEPGAVVVAYGESPVAPRGLFETYLDGRPPRLVSTGDRDWHCGISRDGRSMVVDTSGPWDRPGRGWFDAGNQSSIILIDPATGSRRELAKTGFIAHPYHPHPSFTPDGGDVVFNHVAYDERGVPVSRGAAAVSTA